MGCYLFTEGNLSASVCLLDCLIFVPVCEHHVPQDFLACVCFSVSSQSVCCPSPAVDKRLDYKRLWFPSAKTGLGRRWLREQTRTAVKQLGTSVGHDQTNQVVYLHCQRLQACLYNSMWTWIGTWRSISSDQMRLRNHPGGRYFLSLYSCLLSGGTPCCMCWLALFRSKLCSGVFSGLV